MHLTFTNKDSEKREYGIPAGRYVEITNGVFSGTIARIVANMAGRTYVLELPSGKQYIYGPEEIVLSDPPPSASIEVNGQMELLSA